MRKARFYTELYRSGHNEHDWKSCCRDERHVGSNPTNSARKKDILLDVFFCAKDVNETACRSRLVGIEKCRCLWQKKAIRDGAAIAKCEHDLSCEGRSENCKRPEGKSHQLRQKKRHPFGCLFLCERCDEMKPRAARISGHRA